MRNCVAPTKRVQFNLDNIFNDFDMSDFPFFRANFEKSFSPKVNIVDQGEKYQMTFELPGMDKDKIKLVVKDNTLTISGERDIKTESKGSNFIRTEMTAGKFSRSFDLGDNIDSERVSADYVNGLLFVNLEKKEKAKKVEKEIKIS